MSDPVQLSHPYFGTGTVEQAIAAGSVGGGLPATDLVFVKWTEPRQRGLAGCWIDPCGDQVTLANAVGLARLLK